MKNTWKAEIIKLFFNFHEIWIVVKGGGGRYDFCDPVFLP